ncbi:hypothetical protein AJ80_08924 [Polytolypa hystricis UAMH7299]|uniref:Uncharacterized protein n=1 Tax=Polytolypa hystricis (strain UAMH7299) TaxID=1447883 RepID=A0A2B7WZK9_POLH7|nr:hypothetical protein AJ80_08924 [Polytolypa hystricis UAMH7299]
MALPVISTPPDSQTSYVIPQLEGERITISQSKAKQTAGAIAVFALLYAPGFHYHNHAHDVFLVAKGFCEVVEWRQVPPHGPWGRCIYAAETFGLIAHGDWVNSCRDLCEMYGGLILSENDRRSILIPKIMAAKDQFDVVFQPNYKPPELSEWDDESESKLPDGGVQLYFLRVNTGLRWMAEGRDVLAIHDNSAM